jgi:hypothetical protein
MLKNEVAALKQGRLPECQNKPTAQQPLIKIAMSELQKQTH